MTSGKLLSFYAVKNAAGTIIYIRAYYDGTLLRELQLSVFEDDEEHEDRIAPFTVVDTQYIGIGYYNKIYTTGEADGLIMFLGVDLTTIKTLYNDEPAQVIYWNEHFGQSGSEGGYTGGSFDDSSDDIEFTEVATELSGYTVAGSGLLNVYQVTPANLLTLGADMWDDNFWQTWANVMANAFECLVSLHLVPVQPTIDGTEAIKTGGRISNASGNIVTNDYVDKDLGTLNIPEYWANFLDFTKTDFQLFLPFYGFVNVDGSEFQNGSISIMAHVNVVSGDLTYEVRCKSGHSNLNSVTCNYSTNCKMSMPLTGADYSRMYTAIARSVAGGAMNIGAGNVIGAVGDVSSEMMHAMPSYKKSGDVTGVSGWMGCKKPYLLIKRPNYSFSQGYLNESGIPSNMYVALSSLSGFTQLQDFHLDGIACTMEERELIESALRKGVIL